MHVNVMFVHVMCMWCDVRVCVWCDVCDCGVMYVHVMTLPHSRVCFLVGDDVWYSAHIVVAVKEVGFDLQYADGDKEFSVPDTRIRTQQFAPGDFVEVNSGGSFNVPWKKLKMHFTKSDSSPIVYSVDN